jgi:anti-sigma regulatory factor (Ser/Thr protein kinase)
MSHTSVTGQRPPDAYDGGFRHEAILYSGVHSLVTTLVPWMEEGLDAGDTVVAMVHGRSSEALRESLGRGARAVYFADMAELGRNPARLMSVWQRLLADIRPAGSRIRAIGEPVWPGRSPDEMEECRLHEALVNEAYADEEGFWVLCPYDIGALDPDVVGAIGGTHPLVDGQDCGEYHGHPDPAQLLSSPLPPAVEPVVEEHVALSTLRSLRASVRDRAVAAGLGPHRARDLVLAVTEVCSNSIVHGGGGGVLRSWTTPMSLVHEVNDAGQIDDPFVGRRLPAHDQAAGRGLWLVNELCDLVQLRSSPEGTIVRLHMHRG